MNYPDFIRALSKKSGYAQVDIKEVFDAAAQVLLENLNSGVETAVLRGMIVYPSSYKGMSYFPRARFGTFFKNLMPNQ